MNEEMWYKVAGWGQLYLEEELVVGNEPVLFTCVDEKGQRYLVETLDSFKGEYALVPISADSLLSMLKNETTMERTFRLQPSIFRSKFDPEFDLTIIGTPSREFPAELLPRVGEYFELTSPALRRYEEKLRKLIEKERTPLKPVEYGNIQKLEGRRNSPYSVTGSCDRWEFINGSVAVNWESRKVSVSYTVAGSSRSDFEDTKDFIPRAA